MQDQESDPDRVEQSEKQTDEKLSEEIANLSSNDIEKLIEDLRVHQIELEMQNEQLRLAQETIEEARHQYSNLYDYAPVGYFTLDAKGLILRANLTAASMLGTARGLLTGKPLANFLVPEDRDVFYLHRSSVAQTGTKQTCEVRIRKNGGDMLYGLVESTPVKPKSLEGAVLWSTITDMTEHNRAEEELLHFASVMREINEGVCILSLDGSILFCNTSISKITDCSPEELRGKDGTTLITGDGEKPLHGIINKAIGEKKSWSGRVKSLKKDGTTIYHDVTLSPAKDASGKVSNFVMITRDVTEQENLEQQLHTAQKMEAIGTLAGGIAHDFNNILAAIIGFTEMAAEDVTDRPEVGKSLQNVLKAATRARELVKQILAFSRKTNYERTLTALTPLVKETVQLLRASIPTTIEIRLSVTASSDTILAAPVEVQQILMNLATNASLAMQEKGGILEISLTDISFEPDVPVLGVDVMPGEYIQLVVKDTGVGMTPEVMKRVFEPFFTTREVGKGTGMGLSVVYGIVKDLQGTITMESEPGMGSTFRVFLPKIKAEVENEHLNSVQAPGGRERILFVDDEEMLAEWGRATLQRLGYTVVAMTDSTEALKVFSSDPLQFDLVITDQTMPNMPGIELSKALLKIRPDIPIILCTGHSETTSSEQAKEAGVRQYLMKPLVKQELAEPCIGYDSREMKGALSRTRLMVYVSL